MFVRAPSTSPRMSDPVRTTLPVPSTVSAETPPAARPSCVAVLPTSAWTQFVPPPTYTTASPSWPILIVPEACSYVPPFWTRAP